MSFKQIYTILIAATCLSLATPAYSYTLIDFQDSGLEHGEIIGSQYSSLGLTISAINRGGGPDLAILFDSTKNQTRDPDLEDPWSVGNIPTNEVLGNVLIIAENDTDSDGDGLIDNPDDEGSRPAGTIFFEFDFDITGFGFDLLDVEGSVEYGDDSGYFATFYSDATEIGHIGFGDLLADLTIVYGDNSANRISPITADYLGIDSFNRVEINFGGSAAIDNIQFAAVPEPSTIILFGFGLLGTVAACRSRGKRKD